MSVNFQGEVRMGPEKKVKDIISSGKKKAAHLIEVGAEKVKLEADELLTLPEKKVKTLFTNGKNKASAFIKTGTGSVRPLLPDTQRLILESEEFQKNMEKRFSRYRLMFDKRLDRSYDEILFTLEDLPIFCKEYWFMLFIEPGGKELMCTFGRSRGNYEVNGVRLSSDDKNNLAFAAWYDDNGIVEHPQRKGTFKISPNKITCTGENLNMSFEGKYPKYEFSIDDFAKMSLSKPKNVLKGEFYEAHHLIGGLVGVANLYFDFKGTLKGEPWKGKCHIQKVIMTSPLAPWRWGTFYFEDGSSFSYFSTLLTTLGKQISYKNVGHFYSAKDNKTYKIAPYNLAKVGDGKGGWIFNSRVKDVKCSAKMTTRSAYAFNMKTFGDFTYMQYPTDLNEFTFEIEGKTYDLESLGKGSGFTEDAFGLLL